MKTLVLCAGAPSPALTFLEALKPDVLVGVDAGAAALVASGYCPDWVIGDFDSSMPPEGIGQYRLPREKDDTDLEAALMRLLADQSPQDIGQIVILGALGAGRLDHLLANIWLVLQPRFVPFLEKIHFVERNNDVVFYAPGVHCLSPVSGKPYVSLIGLTPIVGLSTDGLRYPVHRRSFDYPAALISNEFVAEQAHVSWRSGVMCVVQSADIRP